MLRSSLQVWQAAVAVRKEAARIMDSSRAKREARQDQQLPQGLAATPR